VVDAVIACEGNTMIRRGAGREFGRRAWTRSPVATCTGGPSTLMGCRSCATNVFRKKRQQRDEGEDGISASPRRTICASSGQGL